MRQMCVFREFEGGRIAVDRMDIRRVRSTTRPDITRLVYSACNQSLGEVEIHVVGTFDQILAEIEKD
jgi:hypothetical protein